MSSYKTLRALLLISLLVSTTLFPALILIPTASAQTTQSTTFYFTRYGFDFDFFGSSTPVSQSFPTSTNISSLPPQLTNTDDFVNWVLLWGLVKTSDELFNDSYYGEFDFLFDLLNPLLIRESYSYEGEDTIPVQGDAYFTLYFNSYIKRLLPRFQDSIEVKITHKGNTVGNKTLKIEPELLEGIIKKEYKKIIKINDLDFNLQTGDQLAFSLELKLTNKTLPNILRKIPDTGPIRNILTPIKNILLPIINNSQKFENLKNLIELKDQALEILSEFNITKDDIADLFNDALPIHAYFVYDSPDYPSSVTIPANIKESPITTYYFLPNNELAPIHPTSVEKNDLKLKKDHSYKWNSSSLPRNKIITLNNATVSLYLSQFTFLPISLRKEKIKVSIIAGNDTLATTTKEINQNGLGSPLISIREYFRTGPRLPTTFTFSGESQELKYGTSLTVKIELSNPNYKILKPKLFYGTTTHPSTLQLSLAETNNINMTVEADPTTEQIVPGDSITYNISITSKYADTVTINTTKIDETGDWTVSVNPTTLTIPAESESTATLTITSMSNTKNPMAT